MTRIEGELEEKQCWKEAAAFLDSLPKAMWLVEGLGVGVRPWGGLTRCTTVFWGMLRLLLCQAKRGLEQQQQEIIQCAPGGFCQTEIILYCGAFKITGSLQCWTRRLW